TLADAYKNTSHVTEAIQQYQLALGNAYGDDQLTDRCTKGLQDMHFLPGSTSDEAIPDKEHHKLKWGHKGQKLKTYKLAKNEKDPGWQIGFDQKTGAGEEPPTLLPPVSESGVAAGNVADVFPSNGAGSLMPVSARSLGVKPIDPPAAAFSVSGLS